MAECGPPCRSVTRVRREPAQRRRADRGDRPRVERSGRVRARFFARRGEAGRGKAGAGGRARRSRRGLRDAAQRWPGLDASAVARRARRRARGRGCAPRARSARRGRRGLDAVFEQLVTRVGKGDKGQFFTPRHVVDWIVRSLSLAAARRSSIPRAARGRSSCTRAPQARVETWGVDVDARAVRVARLIAAASGDDPRRIARADSLAARGGTEGRGRGRRRHEPAVRGGRGVRGVRRSRSSAGERSATRSSSSDASSSCAPGGGSRSCSLTTRCAAHAWSGLRRWLVEHARVFAVVSLPRETFLPHTSQKAVVVFAKRRAEPARLRAVYMGGERVFFAVSERAGKDAAGEPIFRAGARRRGVARDRP